MGVVYGTAFLTIGILSRNLAVVAFALVVYFAAFLIVLSTWYVRNVMFQDSLFVKMRIYNADGRFLIEVLGKDPKVVREAQPISPGERIDPQKLGIVRFSSTEITKLRVPWECIALILAKHVIAAWLFVKLAFPSVTS